MAKWNRAEVAKASAAIREERRAARAKKRGAALNKNRTVASAATKARKATKKK